MDKFQCRSCGGPVRREGNSYVCKFCGNKWTIDADQDVHVIDRANAWSSLRDGDFEKAAELFEAILFKEPENHEAYWGRALALAGIVYVTDLDENKRVPTCNNITEESFLKSRDVEKAINLAPADIRESYQKQAEYIEAVRIEWLKKASREPEYDVFISFKDSDREKGIERTQDSIDAQDLYNALVAEGYKVFFSRVSLRDKVSEHYEPYIYNAIKTAKVMIVFGERAEYFSSVWIKNEWTRFKTRIEKGEKHKNSLVVVYKNVDPGELPIVLKSRQCLNAADMTFLSDLNRHIKRVIADSPKVMQLDRIEIKGGQISKKATKIANETIQVREVGGGGIAETSISEKQTLDLAKSYVGGGQWEDARRLIDDVLFSNPSYAEALWYQLLVKHRAKNSEEFLQKSSFSAEDRAMIEKILNCADRDYATEFLDLLYGVKETVSESVYLELLKMILPLDYPHRKERIGESFQVAISNDRYDVFKTLLGTLDDGDVDAYIEHNLKYAETTASDERRQNCLDAVLSVDEGNVRALELLSMSAKDRDAFAQAFEQLLKYATQPADEVVKVLEVLSEKKLTSADAEIAKQVLKYYPTELQEIEKTLVALAHQLIRFGFFDAAQYFFGLILSFDDFNAEVYWGICLVKTQARSEGDILRSDVALKQVPEYTKYLTLVNEARRQECIALVKKQERAIALKKTVKKTSIVSGIAAACVLFIVSAVLLFVNVILPAVKYNEALSLMEQQEYGQAIAIFEELDGFGDSENKITECNAAILEEKYNDALALMAAGKYDEALVAFEALEGYKDSSDKINSCKTSLLEVRYNAALALMETGKYDEAIAEFEELVGYRDSGEKIIACKNSIRDLEYSDALALMENGKYDEAISAFEALSGHKDSKNKIAECKKLAFIAEHGQDVFDQWGMVVPGAHITFGKYEQDNNLNNGTEGIEWRVLAVKGGTALVVSEYALDCKPYHDKWEDVTWENCTLRPWLNNEFLNLAFSSEEQVKLMTGTLSGNDVPDRVFLLTPSEVERYLLSDIERMCDPTAYAVAQGLTFNEFSNNCSWWLRIQSGARDYSAYVLERGFIEEDGRPVYDSIGVRPAVWFVFDTKILEEKYNEALALMQEKKYTEAISLFEEIGGYKDSVAKKDECRELLFIAEYGQDVFDRWGILKPGSYITLGSYEQDNLTSNGSEALEWLVLDIKGGKALVISKYALERKAYHDSDAEVTWEKSTLRSWLNSTFLNAAFSSEEQSLFSKTKVLPHSNLDYGTAPGNETWDKVFLLSIAEVNQYFDSNIARRCNPTTYTAAKGAEQNGCSWWLRTPGYEWNCFACVDGEGSVATSGAHQNGVVGVRPAMWIIFDESIFDRQYNEATALMNEGKYEEAFTLFEEIDGYKDSADKIFECKKVLFIAEYGQDVFDRWGVIEVGGYTTFGTYEQDNDTSNGKEEIEWLVLDIKDGKALMISRYLLDRQAYHTSGQGTTWELCTLRSWLNSEFLNAAFSDVEQAAIPTVTVTADPNPSYSMNFGNATQDKLFLLSIAEAKRYFYSNEARDCAPTAYAARDWSPESLMTAGSYPWWLRTTGGSQDYALFIESDNFYEDYGYSVTSTIGIRPAMWIDLGA